MTAMKARNPFFGYRIHLDDNNEVDCVVWQTGSSRGAFEKYGRQIFLDARKSKNMNSIDMRAVTLVVIDPNCSFIPASESFVFEESLDQYRLVCEYTLDMTPGIKAEDVCFEFGDYFLNQEDVRAYFPNIIILLDTFHFCLAKNNKRILLIDFGRNWHIIQADFWAAVYSRTESDCLGRDLLVCITMFHFHVLSTNLNSWFHVQGHLAKAAEKCQAIKMQLTESTSGRSEFIIGHTMYGQVKKAILIQKQVPTLNKVMLVCKLLQVMIPQDPLSKTLLM